MTQAVGGAGGAGGTAPGAVPTGGVPDAPAAGAQVWTDGIQDVDLREWAVNKGYNKQNIAEAAPVIAQQYRNLERLVGAEKAGRTVEIPNFDVNDDAGTAAKNAFFDRIGRPKTPGDYKLELPAAGAVDMDFSDGMAGLLHKAGATGTQATILAKGYQEMAAAREAANAAAAQMRYAEEDKGLHTEWGAKYDDNMKLASGAAKALGIKPEALDALQNVAGYSSVMKMFQNIAGRIGEAQFIDGAAPAAGGKMTPAEAKIAIKSFLGDKEVRAALTDKYHPKHAEFMTRKAQLASWEVGM